jgi:hypothetical protein
MVLGLEGTLSQGVQIILIGSSFGAKAQAAPFRWDDFQNGNPGNLLADRHEPDGSIWDLQSYDCRRPEYAGEYAYDSRTNSQVPGQQRFSGDITALQNFYSLPDGCGSNRAIAVIDEPSRVWYVSFWAYQDDYAGTALQCTNNKIHGNFHGSGWTSEFNLRWDEYWNNESGHIFGINCNGGAEGGIHNTWGAYEDVRNQWIRVERFLDLGDAGISNGYHAGFTNLLPRGEYTGLFTPVECESQLIGSFNLGQYFRSGDTEPAALLRHYISELYVDHSFARVEIGDAPTWNACTHREIQIPTAWNNNSITVTGNVGTFTSGTQVYLFVVDENRQPSVGFPVVIGEDNQQGDLGVPGAPGTVTFTQIVD